MKTQVDKILVTPSPERLISSLMNLGHDFVTAVADIVDNSIEAEATEVSIHVRIDGEESVVCISDNGKGMTPEVMKDAMRFGTERSYETAALGKHGLGLKTASLSQCRKFTVASRVKNSDAGIHALSWDMDHLEKSKKWEVISISEANLESIILEPLHGSTGTVVFWSHIKSLFEYKDPNGKWARNHLLEMCRKLEEHLAMVFHRFLSGEGTGKSIKINLNGNQIKYWDPYVRNEKGTKEYPPIVIEIEEETKSRKGKVTLTPFVLPSKKKFSSSQAFRDASGPNNWNQQQGFYIYRAGRMIQSGGWCGLRAVDEHTKLARIALDFYPDLDEVFSIDVTKMSVQLTTQLKGKLRVRIGEIIKDAEGKYRKKRDASTSQSKKGKSQRDDTQNKEKPSAEKKWTFREIISVFRRVASKDEMQVLENIINKAERSGACK